MSDNQASDAFRKPEISISAGSLEEVKQYIEAGADAVVVGDLAYAERLPGSMPVTLIAEAVKLAHERQTRVYAAVNKIFDHSLLPGLGDHLQSLQDAGVDAVIFGDPAVLMAVRERGLGLRLHWTAEMTTTNYMTANYWASKGASRTILARELNLEEIAGFRRGANHEIQIQVHGMTNIYHSKRKLVKHYLTHRGKKLAPQYEQDGKLLYLVEQERPDERYPIIENENGTLIMSSYDICTIECLDELMELGIDAFYIEGLLKSVEYNKTVMRVYREAIDAYAADPAAYEFRDEWLDAIHELQDPGRELTFGFLFKEQVY